MSARTTAPLAPLFVISLTAIGFEIALTRYFAIASWSEYGYWVISIAMAGFAASGVILSLFKDFFLRRWQECLSATPVFLIIAAAAGFHLATINPFNPLELQDPALWLDQLGNIWQYYAALFPFFFLAGGYVGLCFLVFQDRIPQVYAADLAGAGTGAALVVILMFWVHPFYLLAALLPCLLMAGLMIIFNQAPPHRAAHLAILLVVFAVCEVAVTQYNRADFNQYKSIYPPLHVKDSRVVQEIRSPRGYYLVLDDFTERLDTDFSNNFQVLGVPGPPPTYGVYNDGNRLTSLPRQPDFDTSYVRAALDAFPYEAIRGPDTLLVGTRGGFRIREALNLGASRITALEPGEVLYGLIGRGRNTAPIVADWRVTFLNESPSAATIAPHRFDLIDIASDFQDQADANKYAFTVDAVAGYLRRLRPAGIVSIPISIREFPVYAVKMTETVRRALLSIGITSPQDHVIIYRSSWNARILVSKNPFRAEQIQRLRAFCDARSFDMSYYPGIDPDSVRIWNDLPPVSFEHATVESSPGMPTDDLMRQALAVFSGGNANFMQKSFFDLHPSTFDRPSFYSVLHLKRLPQILKNIAVIPREEIGYLINLAVLLQAVILGGLVLALPLIRWRRRRPATRTIVKSIFYFACLGLGFLFLEIFLIEKMAFFLNDRTYAFAAVVSVMLIASGAGSFAARAHLKDPRRGIRVAVAVVAAWIGAMFWLLDPLLAASLTLSFPVKIALVAAAISPLAYALGIPFPLGLYLFRGERSYFLPWAWSLNGAASVIATPVANLLAISFGYTMMLIVSLLLYGTVYMTYPVGKDRDKLA